MLKFTSENVQGALTTTTVDVVDETTFRRRAEQEDLLVAVSESFDDTDTPACAFVCYLVSPEGKLQRLLVSNSRFYCHDLSVNGTYLVQVAEEGEEVVDEYLSPDEWELISSTTGAEDLISFHSPDNYIEALARELGYTLTGNQLYFRVVRMN